MSQPKSTRDLERDVADVNRRLDVLIETTTKAAGQEARLEVISRCAEFSENIDKRIEARAKSALLFAGIILAALGIFGYFGLQNLVSHLVEREIGSTARRDIESIKTKAVQDLGVIEDARKKSQAAPLIVLQTDYGSKGPYMGALMGVIYKVNPNARVQVITSEIDDFDVLHASWTLWRASRFYPPGTIFVVITNPGGITTLPTVIKTRNGHIYIGHDNGCFDLVVEHYGYEKGWTISSPELSPSTFRDLFGGVDLFGPAAAKLSMGFPLEMIGPQQPNYNAKLPNVRHVVGLQTITGTAMDVDRYGNVTTNVTDKDLDTIGIRIGETMKINFNGTPVQVPLQATYGHVSVGQPVAIIYEGLLQLAVNQASFASTYHMRRATTFDVARNQQ